LSGIKPNDWITLAGVLTALVTAVLATVFARRESIDSRSERAAERTEVQRAAGRREALDTLLPLFAFIADLEKSMKAMDREARGVAGYIRDRILDEWDQGVRPTMLGLYVASGSEEIRSCAQVIIAIVDDTIVSNTHDLEYLAETSGSDEEVVDAGYALSRQISRLRDAADRMAAMMRSGGLKT